MKIPTAIFFATLLSLSATSCYGASDPGSDLSAALRVLWGLLAVLGIILVIMAIAKKRLSFLHNSGKGAIEVIEVKHLMPKKVLYLVSVRGQEYLLGSGGDSLHLIAPIGGPTSQSFDEILTQSEQEIEQ